jgi:Fe2+ or Zn2+ uptake regulation protein
LNDYANILKKHKIKVTPQRLEILKYLDENQSHPTAFQIYSDLKEDNPSFSKTTVYNTLDTLKNHNLVQVLTISQTELRYEFETKLHHHFLCKSCGKISDIDVDCPFFEKMLESEYRVEEVHGYFKGICKNCLSKNVS